MKTKTDTSKKLIKVPCSNSNQLLEVDELEEEVSITSDETPRIINIVPLQDTKTRDDNILI